MLLNNIKNNQKGAGNALAIVFMVGLCVLIIFISMDLFLIDNIKENTQRRLDNAALVAASYATDNKCVITDEAIQAGVDIFNKNTEAFDVDVVFYDRTTEEQRENGVVHFVALGTTDSLFRNVFFNNPYVASFNVESTAVCNTYRDK